MSFYARLFDKYPSVRPLFKTPPEEQHKKLITSVAAIVGAVLSEHLSKEGQWTEAMKETWEAALETVSNIMIEAADNPAKFKEELAAAGFEANGLKRTILVPWCLRPR
jgi:hypothetical protein